MHRHTSASVQRLVFKANDKWGSCQRIANSSSGLISKTKLSVRYEVATRAAARLNISLLGALSMSSSRQAKRTEAAVQRALAAADICGQSLTCPPKFAR